MAPYDGDVEFLRRSVDRIHDHLKVVITRPRRHQQRVGHVTRLDPHHGDIARPDVHGVPAEHLQRQAGDGEDGILGDHEHPAVPEIDDARIHPRARRYEDGLVFLPEPMGDDADEGLGADLADLFRRKPRRLILAGDLAGLLDHRHRVLADRHGQRLLTGSTRLMEHLGRHTAGRADRFRHLPRHRSAFFGLQLFRLPGAVDDSEGPAPCPAVPLEPPDKGGVTGEVDAGPDGRVFSVQLDDQPGLVARSAESRSSGGMWPSAYRRYTAFDAQDVLRTSWVWLRVHQVRSHLGNQGCELRATLQALQSDEHPAVHLGCLVQGHGAHARGVIYGTKRPPACSGLAAPLGATRHYESSPVRSASLRPLVLPASGSKGRGLARPPLTRAPPDSPGRLP